MSATTGAGRRTATARCFRGFGVVEGRDAFQGMEGLPGNPLRIGQPVLVRPRVTAGSIRLFAAIDTGGFQSRPNRLQFVVTAGLQTDMINAGVGTARRYGKVHCRVGQLPLGVIGLFNVGCTTEQRGIKLCTFIQVVNGDVQVKSAHDNYLVSLSGAAGGSGSVRHGFQTGVVVCKRCFMLTTVMGLAEHDTGPGRDGGRNPVIHPGTLAPCLQQTRFPQVGQVARNLRLRQLQCMGQFAHAQLVFGKTSGSLGETSGLLLLLGGIYLWLRRDLDWRIPISILATVVVFSAVLGLFDAERFPAPLFSVFSGGLILGAVYMATDPVTSPITPRAMRSWICERVRLDA